MIFDRTGRTRTASGLGGREAIVDNLRVVGGGGSGEEVRVGQLVIAAVVLSPIVRYRLSMRSPSVYVYIYICPRG